MVLQRSVTVDLTCSCGATAKAKPTKAGNLRLPIGWKRVGAETLCKACKSSRYRLRAVTFPVASVEGSEWKEFTAALRVSWGRATELANWAVRQLLLADGDRKASDTKLAPMPTINLYRLWTDTYHDRAAWAGAAQSANAILHSVEAKYRKARFEVVWLIKDRPPRMTYPVPYPVHNAAWKATYQVTTGKDGQVMREPVVTVTLDGRKWIMRLRGGHEMSRQLKAFAQMASGEALRGELAVYRQRSFGSHRRTASEKSPGGGATVKTRIMVKLVAYLPITKHSREVQGVMEVRTGRKALLVGTAPGRESPWLFHCYELKRLIHDYDAKRQRLSKVLKFAGMPLSGRERLAGPF